MTQQTPRNQNNRMEDSSDCALVVLGVKAQFKFAVEDAQQVEQTEFQVGWKDPILTQMDDLYPIARTHCILRKSDFATTLKRLVNTFRILNLHTTFYNSPNVGATCRSLDQVKLSVNLWESRQDPNGMILEIYRISGDAIVFSEFVMRIFGKVAGNKLSSCDCLSKKRKIATCRTESVADLSGMTLPASSYNAIDALRPVWRMLLDEPLDSRCRGLELLVTLTDISKTDRVVATGVAKVLFGGRDRSMKACDLIGQLIHQTVFHLVSSGQWPDSNVSSTGKSVHKDELPVQLALMALANSAKLLMDATSDVSLLVREADLHMVDEQSFGLAMEYYIQTADQDPLGAYRALRICNFLAGVQPAVKHTCVTLNAVRRAQQIGRGSHLALELQARRLLTALKH